MNEVRYTRSRINWIDRHAAGLEDLLPLLDVDPARIPETSAALAPDSIAICHDQTLSAWADCTVLADATRAALLIAAHTDPANTWSLKHAVRQLKRLNGLDRSVHSSNHMGASLRSRDRSYTEPQVCTTCSQPQKRLRAAPEKAQDSPRKSPEIFLCVPPSPLYARSLRKGSGQPHKLSCFVSQPHRCLSANHLDAKPVLA